MGVTAALFTSHELRGRGPGEFVLHACPDIVAGHGLGDLAALVAAGALDRRAGQRLANARERLIAKAAADADAPSGLLAVLDRDAEQAATRIAARSGVTIARYDSPTRAIVAGSEDQLLDARRAARELGISLAQVRAPAALHAPAMRDAARRFATVLEGVDFRAPAIAVYSSVSAGTIDDPRYALVAALERPVLWTQTIRALAHAGVTRFVEADPAHVLGDLAFEILSVPEPSAQADRTVAA